MKRIVAMLLDLTLIVSMASCGSSTTPESEMSPTQTIITNTDEEREDNMELLNKDQLIKLCGLSDDEYADKDLDAFIRYYKFTEDNVKLFNIHNLLANFAERRNVESVFEEETEERTDNFTQYIDCIAFVENKNTTVNSVYIDVRNNHKWAHEGDYIFNDLNQYDYENISDDVIGSIVSNIYELGVFNLDDIVDSSEEVSDPMSFTFVVKYMDGTSFKVGRTGVPSKICPEYYNQWRNLMF